MFVLRELPYILYVPNTTGKLTLIEVTTNPAEFLADGKKMFAESM